MNIHNLSIRIMTLAMVGLSAQSYSMNMTRPNIDLYYAIVKGNVEQVKACLSGVDNINQTMRAQGWDIVDGEGKPYFVSQFDPNLAADLQANSSASARKTTMEYTPLALASEFNHFPVVRILVETYGAQVNDYQGYSLNLAWALKNHNLEMIRYLRSKGAQHHPIRIPKLEEKIERARKGGNLERVRTLELMKKELVATQQPKGSLEKNKLIDSNGAVQVPNNNAKSMPSQQHSFSMFTRARLGILATVAVVSATTIYCYRHYRNDMQRTASEDDGEDEE